MFVVGNFPTTREHKHKHKPKGPDSAVDERVGFAKLSVFLPNSFFDLTLKSFIAVFMFVFLHQVLLVSSGDSSP